MQKLIDLFEAKIDIVNDSIDVMKNVEDVYVKSMIKGTAFEEFSHLHCMKRYMKDNNIKIPDSVNKRYDEMEHNLMSL